MATSAAHVTRPRLRPDVRLRRQILGGEVFYLASHPETQQFYRFREHEAALLQLLDGESTFAEIAQRLSESAGVGTVGERTVEAFAESLRDLDLIERPVEERNIALYERLRKWHARRRGGVGDILFIKKKLYDPDRFFAWMLRWFGFCWTPTFIKVSLTAAVAAGILVALEWSAFSSDFKTFLASFADPSRFLANYLFVQLTWFWLAMIHESCHGVTCKYFGGEVHEVGFLLFYLQFPGAYTNVNDAWGFEKRSQRIWVTLAGAYSELVLTTIAIFVWWVVPSDSFLHREALLVVTLGFISNIFGDFNPLVKFDGYYILADYLEVPNLQGNSWKHIGYLVRRHLLRLPVDPEPASRRTRRIYTIYGALSFAYIMLLMSAILLYFGGWFHQKMGLPGLLLFAFPAFAILKRPVGSISSTARFFWSDKRQFLLSAGGVRAGLLLAVVAVLLIFLPLFPYHVDGEGLVESVQPDAVRSGAPGRVMEVTARSGEMVNAGDLILRLDNPILVQRAAVEESRVKELQARIRQAEADSRPADARLARSALQEALKVMQRMRLQVRRLELRAPAGGRLDAPGLRSLVGRYVEEGQLLGTVFRSGDPLVRIRIPERLVADVHPGLPARLKTPGYSGTLFRGRVVAVPPNRAPDDEADVLAAERDSSVRPKAYFWVLTQFDDDEGRLRPGLSAQVRVDCGRSSIARRLLRTAHRLMGGKLWLW